LLVERVEAERILAATRGAFADDAASTTEHLLDADVRTAGEAAMTHLEATMAGDDHLKIRAAIEALDLATKPLAQARMNRAVGAQLAGRSLDEVESELAHPHHEHGGK